LPASFTDAEATLFETNKGTRIACLACAGYVGFYRGAMISRIVAKK